MSHVEEKKRPAKAGEKPLYPKAKALGLYGLSCKEKISTPPYMENWMTEEWKTVLEFDPQIDEETLKRIAERYGQFLKVRMGMIPQGVNKHRRFTGRGGQVHKVSLDGRVLDELVEPPPP